MKLSFLTDKDLLLSFILSIIAFIYSKIITFILIYIPDNDLMYIMKPHINIKRDSDSESDSSDNEDNIIQNHNTLEEYNNYLRLWEYDLILYLFKLEKYTFKILSPSEQSKIEYIDKIPQLNNKSEVDINSINIINCFLFNIKVSKNDFSLINKMYSGNIRLLSVIPFKYKLVLFNNICNNYINSNSLHMLFPKHKYLYIEYNQYSIKKYILIDLHKNYNITKHKNILFNHISLK